MTPVPRDLPLQLDTLTLALWLGLLAFGLVTVTSASMEIAVSRFGDPFHHLWRHGAYLMLAVGAFLMVLAAPSDLWLRCDRLALLVAVLALALVWVPGLGREVNGSLRWLDLGVVSLQPSEPARFLLMVYLAGYVTRSHAMLRTRLVGLLRPLFWIAVPSVLLLLQPDFGSVVVILTAAIGVLFLSGARLLHMALAGGAALAVLTALVALQPYRLQRLEAFMNPWAPEVQFGSGYQLTQALIAFGRGEWLGVGLGEGLQKLFYLPEAHTDFIFAVISEELGAVGALVLLAALLLLTLRGLWHGRQAQRRGAVGAAALAYGAALILGLQTLISTGVNTGVLPTKGLTLPLVSYGGNSLVVCSALVAVLVRVGWENAVHASHPRKGRIREALA